MGHEQNLQITHAVWRVPCWRTFMHTTGSLTFGRGALANKFHSLRHVQATLWAADGIRRLWPV